jgi:histidinol-phosphate aminotransferase
MDDPQRYWSPTARRLVPYVPGEQPKTGRPVKLNTNENPYPPSPRVLEAIRSAEEGLKLYPDPESTILREAAGALYGLPPDRVFPGNGSDEVLAHAFLAFFSRERPVFFPDVTYSFYPVYAALYDLPSRTVPLGEDFRLRLEDYPLPNGGVVIANPNAPTGIALPAKEIEAFLKKNTDSLLLVDEAYVDFGAESVVPLVSRYPNLLVVQTLSKSRALAGLRVGLAFGNPSLVAALDRVKNSFNSYPLDRLAVAGAVAAIEDREYFQTIRDRIVGSRETLLRGLTTLGFEVLPSSANFLFARLPGRDAREIAALLRSRQILVRHFDAPRTRDFLRITIGTDEECTALLTALAELPDLPPGS